MTQSEERIPGMMRILAEVAKAANMTITQILSSERRAGIIHARAAVYKLATEFGYSKAEIMWYLDRDRTVGYNYESNIAGHLSQNSAFKALCAASASGLNEYPHRVERSQQRQNSEDLTTKSHGQRNADKLPAEREPVFTDWKGKLGWSFTAEECRREWYAKRAAAEFMRTYGRPNTPAKPQTTKTDIPAEMCTMDAAIYLGISPAFLIKGVSLGYLHRHKKPNISSYWYNTAELDNFRSYIAQHKRGNK